MKDRHNGALSNMDGFLAKPEWPAPLRLSRWAAGGTWHGWRVEP